MIKKSMLMLMIIAFLQNAHMMASHDHEKNHHFNREQLIKNIDRQLAVANSSDYILVPGAAVVFTFMYAWWCSMIRESRPELACLVGVVTVAALGYGAFEACYKCSERKELQAEKRQLEGHY